VRKKEEKLTCATVTNDYEFETWVIHSLLIGQSLEMTDPI